MKYEDFITSSQWRSMRASFIKNSPDARCLACRAVEVQLHHIRYVNFGDEKVTDLAPLCLRCHETFHSETGKAATMKHDVFFGWLASIFNIEIGEVRSRYESWIKGGYGSNKGNRLLKEKKYTGPPPAMEAKHLKVLAACRAEMDARPPSRPVPLVPKTAACIWQKRGIPKPAIRVRRKEACM